MDSYAVEITEHAEKDLRDIYRYIKNNLLAEDAASVQKGRLKDAVFGLSSMPERFPLVSDEELYRQGVRFCPVDNYLLFYVVHPHIKTVYILRVLYARRDWRHLLCREMPN